MSSGNDDVIQMLRPEETNPTSLRQPKLSYTRKFLLSLSDSENCKRLPEGFDESFLSELGSSPQQGFRRNDYSSSPPGKGETGNFSGGLNRWESRSSGRSDTDSQSDRDSDSGRRYGNQFRRSWQNPEHDGLLGSGSFPRSPEYRPGASLPGFRGNDQHQLNRSSDPYHPPRPFKAGPPLRRDKDSYNDETFGSVESTSGDRAEEERKRRAEFEMMRKEQHKELQEKMKSKAMDKLKDDPMTELAASLDSEGDAVITFGLDTSLMKPKQSDSGKSSISSQGHPRPLVPPGFANAAVEKISGPKSLEHPGSLEVGKLEHGHGKKDDKPAPKLGMDDNRLETTSPLASKGGTKGNLSSAFELSSKAIDTIDLSCRAPNTSELSEILRNGNMGIVSENFSGHKIMGETGHSTSILEKLFGGELSVNSSGPLDIIQDQITKTDDVWSPKGLQTSKFAHLFLEEEKKSPESGSVEKSNDLLSLIVGQKGGLIASETKPIQKILPLESNLVKMDTSTPNDAGMAEVLCNNQKKSETPLAFLTCEDLEQSILSNVGESSAHFQPPGIICSNHGIGNEILKVDIDKNASNHLLSLLHKGISSNSNTMLPISMPDKGFPTESQDLNGDQISDIQGRRDGSAENASLGKGLTLETLFGTAFMKELHSADAPVSVQRNAAVSSADVSEPSIPPLVVLDDGALISSVSDARFKMVNEDNKNFHLGGGYQANLDEKVGVNWLNVDRSQTGMDSSKLPSFGMRLPEEDGLTSFGVPGKPRSSMYTNAEMLPSSSNPPVNIAEKLAALGVSVRDERPVAHRQDNSPFLRGPFDMAKPEIPHPSMHAQSSTQFNPAPVNHGRPIFHPLDPHASHLDPQFKFMPPAGITHQDVPTHHQFPANLGHRPYQHPGTRLSEYDHPIHPMLQQMHMPNNRLPSHLLPGFLGGAPPLHSGGNPPGYVQEHNLIQGFPFGQRQPNHGGLGMPLPGPEHGDMNNSPPQALQRLLEMEHRSSQKPMHHPPFAAGSGHSRPMYGHELDAGFWYR